MPAIAPRRRRGTALRLAGLLAITGAIPAAAQSPMSSYEQLQVFSGVLAQVRNNYVDSVDFSSLVQGAIEGMLGSLDPHSRFVSRQDFELNAAYESGRLAGAGLWLESVDGAIVVLAVEPEGPADKAGIVPGDRLHAVNDSPVAGLGASDASIRLLGEKGTRLRLVLERGSRLDPDTLAVTLRRSIIDPRVVTGPLLAGADVGYVRLSLFSPTAPNALEEAVERIRKIGATRLLLDLRGNPGGHMRSLVEIAELFLPAGLEVYHVEGRTRRARDTVLTRRAGAFADLPMVVLVDEGTASAGEILAGTLQDHDRAVIVGRRTFGKALMQSSLPLPGGDVVMLTTGRIVLPSGRVIQRPYSGMELAQYRSLAGTAGQGDTARRYRTSRGREVRGGGGIEPDIGRGVAPLPAWFSVAADSGLDLAVADSVAATLPQDPQALGEWTGAAARWDSVLTEPFLRRVRSSLGVRADPSPAARARMGRLLARRVVTVRWGADRAESFRLHTDPDVAAALEQFGRLGERLAGPAAP